MKKKPVFWIITIVLALALGAGAFFGLRTFRQKKNASRPASTYATHMEYAAYLYNYLGFQKMDTSGINVPYSDMNKGDAGYDIVALLSEYGFLPAGDTFEGEKAVTGEYAAISAVRTMGARNIALLSGRGIDETVSDDECYQLAVREGIVSATEKNKELTIEQCAAILNEVTGILTDVTRIPFQNEYSYIVADDVDLYEVETGTVQFAGGEASDLLVSDIGYQAGDIILFEEKGMQYLKSVLSCEKQDENYELTVVNADPLAVFSELEAQTTTELSNASFLDSVRDSGDVVAEGVLTEEELAELRGIMQSVIHADEEPDEETAKVTSERVMAICTAGYYGGKYVPSTELLAKAGDEAQGFDETLQGVMFHIGNGLIDLVDLDTGVELQLAVPDLEMQVDIYLYVENIHAKALVEIKGSTLKYLEVGFEIGMRPVLSIGAPIAELDVSMKTPISIKLPVPVFSVDFDLGMSAALNGSVNFSLSVPIGFNVIYEEGKQPTLRGPQNHVDFSFSGKVEGEIKLYPIISLSLLRCLKIVDVEPFVGGYAAGEYIVQSPELQCFDAYALPTVGVMVGGGGNSLLGYAIKAFTGVEGLTLYLISPYSTKDQLKAMGLMEIRKEAHYEEYNGNGKWIFVDACTKDMTADERQEYIASNSGTSLLDRLIGKVIEFLKKMEEEYNAWRAENTVASFTDRLDTDVYEPILHYYYDQVSAGLLDTAPFDFGADSLDSFGYAYADINGDGYPELLLGKVDSEAADPIYMIYTAQDGKEPVVVRKTEEFEGIRDENYFATDGEHGMIHTIRRNEAGEKQWDLYFVISDSHENPDELGRYRAGETNPYEAYTELKIEYTPFSALGYGTTAEAVMPGAEISPEGYLQTLSGYEYTIYGPVSYGGIYHDDATGTDYRILTFEKGYMEGFLFVSEDEFDSLESEKALNLKYYSNNTVIFAIDMVVIRETATEYWLVSESEADTFDYDAFMEHGWSEDYTVCRVEKNADSNGNHKLLLSPDHGDDSWAHPTLSFVWIPGASVLVDMDTICGLRYVDYEWVEMSITVEELCGMDAEGRIVPSMFRFIPDEDNKITRIWQTGYAG